LTDFTWLPQASGELGKAADGSRAGGARCGTCRADWTRLRSPSHRSAISDRPGRRRKMTRRGSHAAIIDYAAAADRSGDRVRRRAAILGVQSLGNLLLGETWKELGLL